MNRRKMIMILMALVVVLAGCGKQTDIDATTQTTTEPTVESTAESSVATTAVQETVPGLEDSEFDDDTVPTTEETQPQTESTEPEETTKPTEATKPTETTAPTEPSQPSANPQTEYEAFQNMNAADQQAYMESFESMDDFFNWYNNARAEYEAANPPIDVGDGSFDMGDLMN